MKEPSVPAFGSWWNEDPSQAEDYYAVVFNKLQRAKRNSRYNIANAKNTPFPSQMKLSKQIELPKSGSTPAEEPKSKASSGEPQMNPADEGPSKAKQGSEIQMADEAVQRQEYNVCVIQRARRTSRHNIANTKNAPFPSQLKFSKHIELPKSGSTPAEEPKPMASSGEPQMNPADEGPSKAKQGSEIQMADEAVQRQEYNICVIQLSSEHNQGASQHKPTAQTAQLGMGNIGYKVMDKIKQRVSDVVSHNRNIEVLQTRIQVLMEEIAQVQAVPLSGENDTKNEVCSWFSEATHILQEANGILEDRNSMVDKKRLCSSCWDPTPLWETGEILRGIDKILEKKQFLDLSSCFCGQMYCNKLQSRENKLQEILEALMDIHINIVGINGMIGVGKTVLAKELARRARNSQLFADIMIFEVAESVDVKVMQSQISNRIGLQLSEDNVEETRAQLLYDVLEEKNMERGQEIETEPVQQSKILVILDGLQHAFDLLKVGISVKGKSRCKVLLLSRNADVCKEMCTEKIFSMECLNVDEAQTLFREILKDKIRSMEITIEKYQYMESVMLMKCGGLPLMISSLTSALRSMSWLNWEILTDKMLRHSLLEVDEVKEAPCAILELCNNFIRNGDKRKLFLLCCLIHEQGVDVPLEKLKRYGIGFGLFEEDSLSPVVDRMNLWVHELKSLSLLLEVKPQHVRIHDIIQNVGVSALSQGNNILPVLVDVGTCWHTRESYENCIAISMMSDSNYKCLNGLELNKLRALLLKDIQSLTLPGNFFRGMPGLKVLEISGTKFLELPASIQMKNLVILHLEYCDLKRESISSISKLDKLKVLSLRGSRFKALPEEIGKLTNLRVLDLNSCIYQRLLPVDAVVKMVRLKELYLNGDSNTKLNSVDTKKLSQLPLEVLEISIPRHMSSRRNLKFVNLRRFRILIGGEFGDLEHMSCFSRVILMKYYSCREIVESGLTDLLPTTEYLRIEGVTGLSTSIADLYGHVFLNLKSIYIVNCQMKCILHASRDAFPKLETLTLENLSNLTIICRWKSPSILFPQLRELRLKGLRKLHPYVLPAQLAVQLRVMEVSKCGSLLCIFPTEFDNDTDGADLSLELPYLEILELKYLKRVQSLQYSLESSIKRDKRGLLFIGKIKLPSLKKMHLYGLDQIENMWDLSGSKNCAAGLLQNQPHGVSPWFGNLKSMTVSQRNNINNLFTSTILNSLLQVETLIVEACYQMKEVISGSSDVEDDSSPTTIITFPRLKLLRLASLGSLECFYRGRQWLQFPMLKNLHLTGLTEMKAFVLPTTQSVEMGGEALFDGEIDFPSLEHLEVSHMYSIKLLERQGETTKFSHLSRLTLRRLPLRALPTIHSKTLRFMNLQDLDCCNVLFSNEPLCIPSMSLIMSQEIEELRLSELDSVEDLVDKWFFSLKKLELHRLRQLRTVPWHMLSRLNCLIINQLHSWTSLITTTLLVGGAVLPLLEYIQITDCSSLEAVISREEKDNDFVKYGVTLFPSLKKIQLSRLSRLESFSIGGYEAHFPSLEKMEIVGCPSLHSFSMGPLSLPRLNSVILNSKVMKADQFYDLNSALAAAFHEDTEAARSKEEEKHQSIKALRKKRQQPKELGYLKWSETSLRLQTSYSVIDFM